VGENWRGKLKGNIGYQNEIEIALTLAMNTLCCCWLRIALFVDMAGVVEIGNCRCVGRIRESQTSFRPEAGGERKERQLGLGGSIPHGGQTRGDVQYWRKRE
jgi:hypothetical protein